MRTINSIVNYGYTYVWISCDIIPSGNNINVNARDTI